MIAAQANKQGDRVLFGKWSGTEVKLDGDELAKERHSNPSMG
jgi:co-chaperonin GroES (HSP10)